jgi:GH15 family glucan-1,4-alpha-glucosidase
VGEYEASHRYHRWVNDAIERISEIIDTVIEMRFRGEALDPAHMPPARFALDGSSVIDDWPNFQIDGYGTWLWSLGQHLTLSGRPTLPDELRASVARAARYLSTFALNPCYDVWEESGTALHSSTLACVYGGLVTAAGLLRDEALLDTANIVRTRLEVDAARLSLYAKSSENESVDASSLWLHVPFHVVDANDPLFNETVNAIVEKLTFEGGLRRYADDTYFGSGSWPVLTASLGWHYAEVGDVEGAKRCRDWVGSHFDDVGHLGEQFGGERRDRVHYDEWVERWGPPALDLTWSHAMFVVLEVAIDRLEKLALRDELADMSKVERNARES